jgi:3-phosphoshikimate 1-carboxyvinyltransferase
VNDPLLVSPLDATRPPRAVVRVPGSKSYTNRALVCALLASGRSVLTGALDSDDTRAMADAVAALGAEVLWEGDRISVVGTGGALRPGPLTLYVRDSGTCARFLAPVLARGEGRYVLDGSEQLRRRPMGPMVDALRQAGVAVEGSESLPLTILGTGARPEAEVTVPGNVSSQFISGLVLAGFKVRVTTDVVSAPYVGMTEEVVRAFAGGGTTYAVEPDATAASYFYGLAALFPGSEIEVAGLAASVQGDMAFVGQLGAMGAEVDRSRPEHLVVRGTGTLRAIEIDLRHTPDIAPTLAVVAAFAEGETVVRGIGFVRGHETDRIKAVVTELQRCGVEAEDIGDGFRVVGGAPHGAVVETYGDHRMAMSFALLGLRVPGIEIRNPGCVAKTFPQFWSVLDDLRR